MTLYVSMRTIFCFFFIIFHIFIVIMIIKETADFVKKIIGRASVFLSVCKGRGKWGEVRFVG